MLKPQRFAILLAASILAVEFLAAQAPMPPVASIGPNLQLNGQGIFSPGAYASLDAAPLSFLYARGRLKTVWFNPGSAYTSLYISMEALAGYPFPLPAYEKTLSMSAGMSGDTKAFGPYLSRGKAMLVPLAGFRSTLVSFNRVSGPYGPVEYSRTFVDSLGEVLPLSLGLSYVNYFLEDMSSGGLPSLLKGIDSIDIRYYPAFSVGPDGAWGFQPGSISLEGQVLVAPYTTVRANMGCSLSARPATATSELFRFSAGLGVELSF